MTLMPPRFSELDMGKFAFYQKAIADTFEDHPQRAVHAARRMQEDLKRYSDRLRERGQPPLSVRVGVNSGEVVVRSLRLTSAQPSRRRLPP
jgi:hypothetical protein